MSRWNHAMCEMCWIAANPTRAPITIKTTKTEICCYCGDKTDAGIYVRDYPEQLRCQGHHEEDMDAEE